MKFCYVFFHMIHYVLCDLYPNSSLCISRCYQFLRNRSYFLCIYICYIHITIKSINYVYIYIFVFYMHICTKCFFDFISHVVLFLQKPTLHEVLNGAEFDSSIIQPAVVSFMEGIIEDLRSQWDDPEILVALVIFRGKLLVSTKVSVFFREGFEMRMLKYDSYIYI